MLSEASQSCLKLVPDVVHRERLSGWFTLDANVSIIASGAGADSVTALLGEYLGISCGVNSYRSIILNCEEQSWGLEEFPDESYTLEISPLEVRLNAPRPDGLARAIQTLRQLLPPECLPSGEAARIGCLLPCVRIEDSPAFPWRGMHLDVARHFFCVDDVCRFIDLIALHRFNRLHLHLTDDQGWRLEIKAFPRLTEVGGRRPCTLIGRDTDRPRQYDNIPHEGWFSQDDIKEIITFAARRHIEIIPEIDLPGHMLAAICAYPELGNGNAPKEPLCHWGISQTILNAEPETSSFLESVFEEVTNLFPGTFVHVGGDEVPTYEWEHSRRVQKRLLELGLPNERSLQRWYINNIQKALSSKGRRLVAWDEVLDATPPTDLVIMNWRYEQDAANAARRGHDVVTATSDFTYFDFYQADPISEEPIANGREITTARVYAFNPIPHGLESSFHPHILGAQGQLWTEYIATRDHLDYMAFPRACALAEVLWLHSRRDRFISFRHRLDFHRTRLSALGVNSHPRP